MASLTFQSSARINTGCNGKTSGKCGRWYTLFQSSARINTGCNFSHIVGVDEERQVSILSPHQHGLQLAGQNQRDIGAVFQSSARINTGCNHPFGDCHAQIRFQSSARINTGCNEIGGRHGGFRNVSILSPHQHGLQPVRRGRQLGGALFQSSARINTGCNLVTAAPNVSPFAVSILSPHQHGLQLQTFSVLSALPEFQSSARINTGCN